LPLRTSTIFFISTLLILLTDKSTVVIYGFSLKNLERKSRLEIPMPDIVNCVVPSYYLLNRPLILYPCSRRLKICFLILLFFSSSTSISSMISESI
jgi:hypothetical protein